MVVAAVLVLVFKEGVAVRESGLQPRGPQDPGDDLRRDTHMQSESPGWQAAVDRRPRKGGWALGSETGVCGSELLLSPVKR